MNDPSFQAIWPVQWTRGDSGCVLDAFEITYLDFYLFHSFFYALSADLRVADFFRIFFSSGIFVYGW